jgi:hypothetical protein
MPYRVINDGAARKSDLFPHITLEGAEICKCETLAETKEVLSKYAAAGMDVSAVGWEPTTPPEMFMD